MKLINTAFVRLCLLFIAGILAGFYAEFHLETLLISIGLLFLFFLLVFLRSQRLMLQDWTYGLAVYLMFFGLGLVTTALHLPRNQPNHFTHHISSSSSPGDSQILRVAVKEELKPDLYNKKFIAEVTSVNSRKTHGKTLILLPADSLAPSFQYGDLLLIHSELREIATPVNPHQFNYRSFMENRGIYYQANLRQGVLQKIGRTDSGLLGFAENIRNSIRSNLEGHSLRQEELAIIQALLLGQRQQISEETFFNYAAAGVIHILAVSGLHVGIILLILHRLLSPLSRLKRGKFLRTAITIVLLWLFALLAGLSPSVVRAVTMFSFLAVALQMRRRTSVTNTLFLSLMALLLVRPQFLFEVGFQLSYLAVFSIVLFQPLLYNLFSPGLRIFKYLWGILSVTLAAQAGVLPLSLLYFHQFPGLFFLSNLVILPFLGIILGFGIIIIFLAVINALPAFLAEAYGSLVQLLNNFVHWVALQENFLFTDIPFSGRQAVAFYLLLLCLFLLLKSFSYRRLIAVFTAVVVLQLVFYYEAYTHTAGEFVVFHKSRHTLIGVKENRKLLLAHQVPEDPMKMNQVKNYVVGENIKTVNTAPLENIYRIKDKLLLVIDSTGTYQVPGLKPNYILLSNSPRVNLERVIEAHNPEIIIADGSNYRSFITRWRGSSTGTGTPFHYTADSGAFILKTDD